MNKEALDNFEKIARAMLDAFASGEPFTLVATAKHREAVEEAVQVIKNQRARTKNLAEAARSKGGKRRKPDSEVSKKALQMRRWRAETGRVKRSNPVKED